MRWAEEAMLAVIKSGFKKSALGTSRMSFTYGYSICSSSLRASASSSFLSGGFSRLSLPS